MHALPELQAGFAAALLDASRAEECAAMFRGRPERALARLAIYRGNVFGNWGQALASAYPIVRKIVGAEFFESLARAFAKAQPSASGDLNAYGEYFAGFLDGFEPVADLPYLPDVARMEWLAHRAHFAADAPQFDAASLADIPAERHAALLVRLAPGCALLASDWPLGRIWTVHQDEYQGAIEVDLAAGLDRVLVHRPRWAAEVVSISAGDYAFFDTASRGVQLGEALEAAAAADPEFQPSTALAHWIHVHVIVALV